ncbi:hypothetical protein D9M70_637080 [compost metagenome]
MDLYAASAQAFDVRTWQGVAADPIVEHMDQDAGCRALQQQFLQAPAERTENCRSVCPVKPKLTCWSLR